MRQEIFGGLDVRILGGEDGKGGGDGPAVILLHGFGAPGDDLVPLAHFLGLPARARFVFPEAPIAMPSLFGDLRAWWMIDVERLERDLAAGMLRDLSILAPDSLSAAREQVIAMLGDVESELGASPESTVLGGFSQGAMLALDVTLRTNLPFAALVLMSCTLLCEKEWASLTDRRRGLRVFQTHGRHDPLLPFPLAVRLRAMLADAGLCVDWREFEGGHEIPLAEQRSLGGFVREVTALSR